MASGSSQPTPTKRRFIDSKVGYIQQVSPLCTSRKNRKYFNAVFQTQTAYENLVSFSPEKHKTFMDMSKARTAVSLVNTDTLPSITQPGTFDLKFTSYSQLESPKETLTFPYKELEISGIKVATIQEIKTSCLSHERITLSCTVQDVSPTEEMGRDLVKCLISVADHTGKINIAIWNEQIDKIEDGKSYKFQNIGIRMFDGVSLTTSPGSIISEIDALENVQPEETTLHPIDAVEVTTLKNCIYCNFPLQINENIPTVRCEHCHKKMLIKNLVPVMTTKVTVNNRDVTISAASLNVLLPEGKNLTTEEIEDFILLQTQAKLCNNNFMSLIKKE